MKKFIPLEKRSKKEQKEYYAGQRRTWGSLSPVTRTVPNGKAYNRKKKAKQLAEDPEWIFSQLLRLNSRLFLIISVGYFKNCG